MEATTNKKKDNTALYIVYATAAYFGLQFLMKPKRAAAATIKQPVQTNTNATNTNTAYETYQPETSKWTAESFPLRKGMKGSNIKVLQKKLGIAADGAFGNNTESVLLQQYGISTVSQAQFKSITAATLPASPAPVQSTATTKWIAESFPLRKGMKGNNIKVLQQKLGIAADGAFGNNTETALSQQHGINSVSLAQFQSITSGSQVNTTTATSTNSTVTKWIAESFPLRKGMKGNNVKLLQQHLGVPADGAFGNNTETALLQRYGVRTLTQQQFQIFTGKAANTNTTILVTNNTPIKWIAESYPLRKGMKGAKVKAIQQKLGISADGAFGNDTEAALLQKFGITTVSMTQYLNIISGIAIKTTTPAATPKVPAASNTPVKWIAERFPLQYGMKGNNVKLLQQKLGLTADGDFGLNTQSTLLLKYGTTVVDQILFQRITQSKPGVTSVLDMLLPKPNAADNSAVLKSGSRGNYVYRLQKWLGFKDKSAAKKRDLIADSIFGKQTVIALQKKTGKSSITLNELNKLTKQVAGIGYLGETLVTRRSATVFDNQLQPYRTVPGNTILGTRTMELKDLAKRKAYTQFQSIDGIRRWIESDAL